MPCTTILVGKGASCDGSTMISRTEDYRFSPKKLVTVLPKDQPKKYKTVTSHLEVDLPEEPMAYTATPNVDPARGYWGAHGINAANVGMTATETITTNPRVQAADPLVVYQKAKTKKEKDIPGGIGEEDFVMLVLPYVKTAKEGAKRLGALLEKYGTYEKNGIAFNDENEVWWLETIGGHHWIAARVQDDEVVIMPNQLGIDRFDLEDALGEQKNYMCSADMKEFIEENRLNTGKGEELNPRLIFGSRSDKDHIFNTVRGWMMAKCLCPETYKWQGEDACYTPESDDIPWALVPEYKVTPEDVKYILSTHYQGTPYDPYSATSAMPGKYRTIACPNTNVMTINQIRGYMPEEIRAVEWICFGNTLFDAMVPVYSNVKKMPAYMANVTMEPSTENFCWASRMLGAIAEPHYPQTIQLIERYQETCCSKGRQIILEYDKKMTASGKYDLMEEANEKVAAMAKKETAEVTDKVLVEAYAGMKCKYNRAKY